jgi:hypothetical protein
VAQILQNANAKEPNAWDRGMHAPNWIIASSIRIVAATSMYFQYCISRISDLHYKPAAAVLWHKYSARVGADEHVFNISDIVFCRRNISPQQQQRSTSTYAHFGAESVAFYAPQCTEVNLKKIQVTNTIAWVHFAFEITETSKSKHPLTTST